MFTWVVGGIPRDYRSASPVQTPRRITAAHQIQSASPVDNHASVAHADPDAGRPNLKGYQLPHPEPRPREKAITVEQIMSAPVITASAETTLAEAREIFKLRRFRHIPVVDHDRRLIGIVSDRDLLHAVDRTGPEPRDVREIMTETVLTTLRDTPIRHVARVLFAEHIGAMPVIEDGRPIGIVTTTDILRTVMNEVPLELWI